jgi:hypothetical protein
MFKNLSSKQIQMLVVFMLGVMTVIVITAVTR